MHEHGYDFSRIMVIPTTTEHGDSIHAFLLSDFEKKIRRQGNCHNIYRIATTHKCEVKLHKHLNNFVGRTETPKNGRIISYEKPYE